MKYAAIFVFSAALLAGCGTNTVLRSNFRGIDYGLEPAARIDTGQRIYCDGETGRGDAWRTQSLSRVWETTIRENNASRKQFSRSYQSGSKNVFALKRFNDGQTVIALFSSAKNNAGASPPPAVYCLPASAR